MNPTEYLFLILAILIGNCLLRIIVELLNMSSLSFRLPDEFQSWYDPQRYEKAQRYLKENTVFDLIETIVTTSIVIFFIVLGMFNYMDRFARILVPGEIVRGLLFAGLLYAMLQLINIPFSFYHTFVIEEKYGFNKMTVKTFITDTLKHWILGIVIGGIALTAVLWFFMKTGSLAWVFCWLAVTLFQIFLIFIAPAVIMPLFNKFTPLAEGELKTAIESYARAQNFKIKGIFSMDSSRRSSKSNAFFTGLGKYRRIVLFDTLIAKHSIDELVSVLAHEVGHYKHKHLLKYIAISVVTNGLLFFILGFFINNPALFAAFKMEHLSIYASLLFFSFLYTPINLLLSILLTALSRKHEYEADHFAVTTYQRPQAFIDALKKLTVDNLSNLTPHSLKVVLDYSHPPVLKRIKAIRQLI